MTMVDVEKFKNFPSEQLWEMKMIPVVHKQIIVHTRGGSRIFSRGRGADFQKKKIENLVDYFFRSTKLSFRAPPRTL